MRNNDRRRLGASLAAVLALSLLAASCGDDEDSSPSQDETAAADTGQAREPATEPGAEPDAGSQDESTEDVAAAETEDDAGAAPSEESDSAEQDDTPAEAAPAVADGEPIRVGNVSSLSGGGLFPEASVAARAVFDRVNAEGGIGGRPIELIIEDDGGTPEGAATAGRRLVEQDNVVAMVGSASILECAVNSGFYAEQGVYSIQGTGVDPLCFLSSNISPVNTGPFAGITVSLYYASETLALDRVCNISLFVIPDLAPAFDAAVARWESITGKSLTFRIKAATLEDDPTPLMLQARDAGCQAVVIDGVEPHALAVGRAIDAQDLSDIVWIGLTSYYTDAIAAQLGSAGNGLRAQLGVRALRLGRSCTRRLEGSDDQRWRAAHLVRPGRLSGRHDLRRGTPRDRRRDHPRVRGRSHAQPGALRDSPAGNALHLRPGRCPRSQPGFEVR